MANRVNRHVFEPTKASEKRARRARHPRPGKALFFSQFWAPKKREKVEPVLQATLKAVAILE